MPHVGGMEYVIEFAILKTLLCLTYQRIESQKKLVWKGPLDIIFAHAHADTFWSKQGAQDPVQVNYVYLKRWRSDNLSWPLSQCIPTLSLSISLDLMTILLLVQPRRGLGASLQHCIDVPRAYDQVLIHKDPQIN